MSHFPPPAADDVIYREAHGGGRRGLPRWVPVAGALGVVALLAIVGLVAFGGDDEGSASPWRLLRWDTDTGIVEAVQADGGTAGYEPVGTLAGLPAPDEPRSTLLVGTDDDAGTIDVLDTLTGEQRTISPDADGLTLIRVGDAMIGTSSGGGPGRFVDLRTGVALDLHDAFGVPSDVRLFSVQPIRDGVAAVFGDGGAGVFDMFSPGERQWFDGAVYDATGSRVVAGSIGAERTLTLYDAGVAVGSPVTVEGRVRIRLLAEGNTALVVSEDGAIRRANFDTGELADAGRIAAAVMDALAAASSDLSVFFLTDDRFLVEVDGSWSLIGADGAVVAEFSPAALEPGASELSVRGVGSTCVTMVVGGDVPDRTVAVDIATGEVRVAVAGQVFGPQSDSGCSFVTAGNADILVVEGVVVDVPGAVLDFAPDFSLLVVRDEEGDVATRAATLYTVRDGALVDPVTLEPGQYLYWFVTATARAA